MNSLAQNAQTQPDNPAHALLQKNKIIAWIIAAMGLILLVQWIYNLAHRIPFPYPIEYIEDAVYFQAMRIYNGKPVYTDPNSGYAALIYSPIYFYLLAGLLKIFTPTIIIGRLISLICVIITGVLLWKISSERLKFPLSLAPLCVYFSLPYSQFAGYQDLGRVDPLMTLLLMYGLYLIHKGEASRWGLLTGTLMLTAAFYVKQPAMAYLYFVYIFLYLRFKTYGLFLIVLSFVLLLGIFFIANAATGGWFGFYTWDLPMTHTVRLDIIGKVFLGGEAHGMQFPGMPYLAGAGLLFLIFRTMTLRKERVNVFEATLPGAVIATVVPFVKEGGFYQDLIPMATHLCFVLPFALSLPLNVKRETDTEMIPKGANLVTSAMLFLLMLHCVYSITPWSNFAPTPGNRQLARDYVEKVRQIDGDVLMPSLSYYAALAGKEQEYNGAALVDLLYLGIRPLPLLDDVSSRRYAAILLPDRFDADGYWQGGLVEAGYEGPTHLINKPFYEYNLCFTIEPPPDKVYLREASH